MGDTAVPQTPSSLVIPGAVRGNDVAYDPINGVYLAVGVYGTVRGAFVDANGVAVGSSFLVAPPDPTKFAHYPRVAYSPDLSNGTGGFGAFLVTWHDLIGGSNFVHAQVVSKTAGGPIGGTLILSDTPTFWEAGAPLAYSPASRVFLVAWQTCCGGGSTVRAQRLVVNASGGLEPLGGGFAVSAAAGRDPSVAYNGATGQFGVSYSGWDDISATVSLAIVGADGVIAFRDAFRRSGATYITDIAVNSATGRYLVAWSEGGGTQAAEIEWTGATLGLGLVASIVGTYDSCGIAYNPGSGTFLLVGHHAYISEVGAAELSSRGARVSAEIAASRSAPLTGAVGAFYPRTASNGSRWLHSFARDFGAVYVHGVLTTSTGGAGGGALPPPGGGGSGSPPTITTNPSSQTIGQGATATLSVVATGTPPLSYQWYLGSSPSTASPIGGATSSSYTTPALQSTTSYWVRVSNTVGIADSATATVTVSGAPPPPPPGSGSVAGDFDGDGRAEVTVFRPSNGVWYRLLSSTAYGTSSDVGWGAAGDVPVTGDFDGDGKNEVTVYRPSTGYWYILLSITGFTSPWVVPWGVVGDQPVAADFDGDDKADIAVYRPSNGAWYILTSSTGFAAASVYVWGIPGDRPVPGDYDGDGKADPAVYRPSLGYWFVLKSSTGYATGLVYQWGASTDVPVAGDYDGDGKTDIAVYRPSEGYWYVLTSGTNFTGGLAFAWGASGDVPVVSDFDGDGRTDVSVYRASTGIWYILKSSTGFTGANVYAWGNGSDVPVLKR